MNNNFQGLITKTLFYGLLLSAASSVAMVNKSIVTEDREDRSSICCKKKRDPIIGTWNANCRSIDGPAWQIYTFFKDGSIIYSTNSSLEGPPASIFQGFWKRTGRNTVKFRVVLQNPNLEPRIRAVVDGRVTLKDQDLCPPFVKGTEAKLSAAFQVFLIGDICLKNPLLPEPGTFTCVLKKMTFDSFPFLVNNNG